MFLMSRRIISFSMSLLFLALIAAPTVISIVDKSIDVSCFYVSGEEEDTGSEKAEKNKEKEALFFELAFYDSDFVNSENNTELEYFFKTYSKPHLNLISPPPQFYI